ATQVACNQHVLGSQVTLTTLADLLDADNPLKTGTLTGATPITYTPNPVTPSLGSGQTVTLTNMTTASAPTGTYKIGAQGQAGAPSLTTKPEPISIKVGSVNRDFSITSDASNKTAPNVAHTGSLTLNPH